MKPLWTVEEIASALRAKTSMHGEVFGVSIDTRTLQPGDLFIAHLAQLIYTPNNGHELPLR